MDLPKEPPPVAEHPHRPAPLGAVDYLQIVAAVIVAAIGGYLAFTDRWAIGGTFICVGLTILPVRWLGILGGVGMVVLAGLGWYLVRLTPLPAVLILVLGVLAVAERLRRPN